MSKEIKETVQEHCITDEPFGIVRWNNEDLEGALKEAGIDPTEENVSILRKAVDTHFFTDYMISAGWDYINSMVNENAELMDDEWEAKR